jgi:CubicO group peptidase (beta-lactamase class C family)
VQIQGEVAPGFEPVLQMFQANFDLRGEIGASLCVYQHGRRVVDLWAGLADRGTERAWEADTLVNVFSATKGMVAACFLVLEDRDEIELDAPVCTVWPEFGEHGKDRITVRHVLNHRSGVVALPHDLSFDDLEDHDTVDRALERAEILWEPGEEQGYHAVTYGVLCQAVFRRVTGQSLGTFLANEIAGPLAADVFLGLDPQLDDRVATLYPAVGLNRVKGLVGPLLTGGTPESRLIRNVILRPRSPGSKAVRYPRALGGMELWNYNLPRVRRMELPWSNGHASARGLARMYAPLSIDGAHEGVRLVSAIAAARPIEAQSWSELDLTMRKPMGWSQGFLKEQSSLFSPNPSWFGHPGIGGSMGYADPAEGISLGYVVNRMRPKVRSPTALAISRSLYESLGTPVPT